MRLNKIVKGRVALPVPVQGKGNWTKTTIGQKFMQDWRRGQFFFPGSGLRARIKSRLSQGQDCLSRAIAGKDSPPKVSRKHFPRATRAGWPAGGA